MSAFQERSPVLLWSLILSAVFKPDRIPHTCHFEADFLLCQVNRLDGMEPVDHIGRSLTERIVGGQVERPAALEVGLALEEKHEDQRWHLTYNRKGRAEKIKMGIVATTRNERASVLL